MIKPPQRSLVPLFSLAVLWWCVGCAPDESPFRQENENLRKQLAKQATVLNSLQDGNKVMQQQIDLLNQELRDAKKQAEHAQAEAKALQAEANRTAVVPIVPNRGIIVDRNGTLLAHNYSAYTLEIRPAKVDDLELTAADAVAQNASQSFDISVWQLLSALLAGGRLCIPRDEVRVEAGAFLDWMEARADVRARSEFLSQVSHDLRTPLTSIRMFAETLQLGRAMDPAQTRECLDARRRRGFDD